MGAIVGVQQKINIIKSCTSPFIHRPHGSFLSPESLFPTWLMFVLQVDEELEALLENGDGLSDEKQVISLCRLMVRVETMEHKLTCVKLIQVGSASTHLSTVWNSHELM